MANHMLFPYVGDEEIRTTATLGHEFYCPRCAADLTRQGFVSAFWQSEAIVFYCSCGECRWQGDISESTKVFGYEPDNEEPHAPRLTILLSDSK